MILCRFLCIDQIANSLFTLLVTLNFVEEVYQKMPVFVLRTVIQALIRTKELQ
jgi:hypothetical protein